MDINCSSCGKSVQVTDKFCPHCGNQVANQSIKNVCPKCNHENPSDASFCEKCGTSLKTEQDTRDSQKSEPAKIVSKGSYSGKMTKGKTSKGWKVLRNIIIAIIVLGIIALIVWFQVDPEAGEKLKTVAGGLLVVAIFIFFIYRSAKKGKKRIRRGYDDQDWNHDDDNDYDSDDGGDDD